MDKARTAYEELRCEQQGNQTPYNPNSLSKIGFSKEFEFLEQLPFYLLSSHTWRRHGEVNKASPLTDDGTVLSSLFTVLL